MVFQCGANLGPPGRGANEYSLKLSLLSKLSENSNPSANDFWQVRGNQCLEDTEGPCHTAPASLPSPGDQLPDVADENFHESSLQKGDLLSGQVSP